MTLTEFLDFVKCIKMLEGRDLARDIFYKNIAHYAPEAQDLCASLYKRKDTTV